MPLPPIDPPLLNSSNPWATTTEDLQKLFDCESTGAVTTRTSLLHGFEHDDKIHQYTFFHPEDHRVKKPAEPPTSRAAHASSLNTLGYSPLSLSTYLASVAKVAADSALPDDRRRSSKPFIISVTGSAAAVAECHARIQAVQAALPNPLCMEINLSCPNIPGKPPPAYSGPALAEYLDALAAVSGAGGVPVGIKTPPYTYHEQFRTLVEALLAASKPVCPVDFITATNTLGGSLVLADTTEGCAPALSSASGAGIGGMAGSALHPLALGNVRTIRGMLDAHEALRGIDVIGVGGVGDHAGFRRMRSVGAKVVGVGTALGVQGTGVFGRILKGV